MQFTILFDFLGELIGNWIAIFGFVTLVILQVPKFWIDEWDSRQKRLLRRFRPFATPTAIILIFVASFMTFYDAETARKNAETERDDVRRQLSLLSQNNPETIAKCNSNIEWLGQAEGESKRFNARQITRLVRITGNPYSVVFEAHGVDLLNLEAKSSDPNRLDVYAGPKQLKPEGIRLTIQEPRGLYNIFVIAKDPNTVALSHKIKCET